MIVDVANYASGLMQRDVTKWLDMATVRERCDDDNVTIFDYYEQGNLIGSRYEGLDIVFTSYGSDRMVQNLMLSMEAILIVSVVKVGMAK